MAVIDLKNVTYQTIEIKKEHGFEVCFELGEEVLGGFQMDTSYNCEVKHWKENVSVLFSPDVSVNGTVITVSSDTKTGLRIGEYFFSIQPTNPELNNYLTIEGDFIVE